MVAESVQSALQSLKLERARIDDAISALEGLMGRGKVARKAVKAAARVGRVRRKKRAKAPRGLLKQKIHEVLKAARKPLPPFALRDQVLKAGYPATSKKSLYTAIFIAAKKDPALKKTSQGFALK